MTTDTEPLLALVCFISIDSSGENEHIHAGVQPAIHQMPQDRDLAGPEDLDQLPGEPRGAALQAGILSDTNNLKACPLENPGDDLLRGEA